MVIWLGLVLGAFVALARKMAIARASCRDGYSNVCSYVDVGKHGVGPRCALSVALSVSFPGYALFATDVQSF